MSVSPKTHPLPKVFFFHLVEGTRPTFSFLKTPCNTWAPRPNFFAVKFNRSTPSLLATS